MPPSNSSTRSNHEFTFPLPIFAVDGPQLSSASSSRQGPDFQEHFGSGHQPSAAGPGSLTPDADRTTFAKQPPTSTPTVHPGRESATVFPPINPALCSHTTADLTLQRFEETFPGDNPNFGYPHYPIPLDENGNPHPMLLASLGLQPQRAKTPYHGLVTPPNSAPPHGSWNGPTTPVSPTAGKRPHKTDDGWLVITSPQTTAVEYKPPSRRKEAFHHTSSPKTQSRLEWVPESPPMVWPVEPPRKKRNYSEGHSEMGWALVKLREPGDGRAKYTWSIAQIHEPRFNHYLILSGPWVGQIKTIRSFDRLPYSQDQVAKLRRGKQYVHEEIRISDDELSLRSSTYAVEAATSSFGL